MLNNLLLPFALPLLIHTHWLLLLRLLVGFPIKNTFGIKRRRRCGGDGPECVFIKIVFALALYEDVGFTCNLHTGRLMPGMEAPVMEKEEGGVCSSLR